MDLATIQAGGGGLFGALARAGLSVASWPYGFVARRRLRAYDPGGREPARLGVRVACVGNLTAGGTGKTPFVAWLAREALARGRRPAVLSRGYGPPAAGSTLSDEGALLTELLGGRVPVVEDADRVRGGRAMLAAHPSTDLVLLDDGFQHRRLARDVDVVLLDATCPFGYERLLPRGLLREPSGGLSRAHAVVITRAERVDRAALDAVSARVAALAPSALRAAVRTVPLGWRRACDGAALELEALRGRRVVVWAGIGNPRAFAAMVRDVGAEVVLERFDRDHRPIAPAAVRDVLAAATARGATHVVVTRKDLVKIAGPAALPESIVALDIDLESTPELARVADLVIGTPPPA